MNEKSTIGAEFAVDIPTIALPIGTAAVSAGVTRTRIYDAIAEKELTARKAGRQTVIEVSELHRWVRSLPTRGRQPATEDAAD